MAYTPTYTTGSTAAETAQKTGLGTGVNILKNTLNNTQQYPEDYTSKLTGPATADYYQNQTYQPLNTVSALSGGDYEALLKSLQDPIMSQATTANNSIKSVYGGNGLYGSVGGGLMSGAQAQSQEATQNALSNAVASRYNLQLQDNQQQIDQNQNIFTSGAQAVDQANNYNANKMSWDKTQAQSGIDFNNAKLASAADYIKAKQAAQTSADEVNYQRALQLAGLGNSGAAINAQTTASNNALDAQSTAALYSGLGSAAGGLMGSYDTSGNTGWNVSGLWEGISNLWK